MVTSRNRTLNPNSFHIAKSGKTARVVGLLLITFAVAYHTRPASAEANAAGGNSVVAVVNADPITRDALADAVLARYGVDVLDNMINRHLILQECQARGAEVTPAEVRAEVLRLAKKFGLTLESYLKLLQDERDITPDQYSREIIWPMLALRGLVADQVEVTQAEFNEVYLSQYGEAVKCRMIMVDDPSLASQIHEAAIADPQRFATLAKQHSQDETSASVGGLIPPIRRFMGDSRIEDAVFALSNNGVSDVLHIGDQYLILQAVRRMAATTPSPQAMPAIREQIQDRIRDDKMRIAATKLFEQLQTQAKVQKVLGNDTLGQQYPGVAAIINGQQIPIASVAAQAVKRHGNDVLQGEINRKLLNQ
ncbi:MAG: peptidylprolyl isomerase, partial [Planctomycetota bacterium]